MQSMQRQFGKLMNKGPGNNAKVSVILKEYEDADSILAKVRTGDPSQVDYVSQPLSQLIDSCRLWRDSWASLAASQLAAVVEFEALYDPIVGATDGHGKELVATPDLQLHRTYKLRETYAELKDEMLQEIAHIDNRLMTPATSARDYIAPIRKTIKKRENKRLDYERVQDKVTKLSRKPGKTPKEESSLAKAEQEMSILADVSHARACAH
jgi:amphiphysin